MKTFAEMLAADPALRARIQRLPNSQSLTNIPASRSWYREQRLAQERMRKEAEDGTKK